MNLIRKRNLVANLNEDVACQWTCNVLPPLPSAPSCWRWPTHFSRLRFLGYSVLIFFSFLLLSSSPVCRYMPFLYGAVQMHGCRAGERVSPISFFLYLILFVFSISCWRAERKFFPSFFFPLCGFIRNVIGPKMIVWGWYDGLLKKPCVTNQCITSKIIFHCYSCLLLQGELPRGTWLYSF